MLSLGEQALAHPYARWLGINTALAAGLVVLGKLSLLLYGIAPGIAPLWPVAGVLTLAALHEPRRSLPGQLGGMFLLVVMTSRVTADIPIWPLFACLLLSGAYMLAAYGGSLVLKRYALNTPLQRCEDAYRLLISILVCAFFHTLIGPLWLALGYRFNASYGDMFFISLIGNWLGILLLLLPSLMLPKLAQSVRGQTADYIVATIAILAVTLLLVIAELKAWPYSLLLCDLYFCVLAWIAWRSGLRPTLYATVLMALLLALGTACDFSPFVRPWRREAWLMLDAWLIIAMSLALVLCMDAGEHRDKHKDAGSKHLMVRTWAVLLIGLFITSSGWQWVADDEEARQLERFNRIVTRINGLVTERMLVYEGLLRGSSGLFAASISVERDEWEAFIKKLEVNERFPGVEGFGFARRVGSDELEGHEIRLHKEGFPDYKVMPDIYQDEYFPIEYIEPFSGTNRVSFGRDMYSEALRKIAMDKARDGGVAVMSSKVTLFGDQNEITHPGFVIFMPIYRNKFSHTTLAERRATLLGYVYASFHSEDLMNSLLKQQLTFVNVKLYNGNQPQDSQLLFRHTAPGNQFSPTLTRNTPLDLFGHQWLLQLSSSDAFDQSADRYKEIIVFSIGALASIFLFVAIRAVMTTGEKARRLAAEMMLAFQGAEARYGALAQSAMVGMVTLNAEAGIESMNPAAEEIFGRKEAATKAVPLPELFRENGQTIQDLCDALSADHPGHHEALELVVQRPAGEIVPVLVSVGSWLDSAGRKFGLIVYDITSRVAAEAALAKNMTELARSNHDLDRFAYIASHDLRAPLRGMGQIVGWIEEDLEQPNATMQSHLDLLRQRAGRLDRLLQDLLEYSRAGRLQGQPEAFSLQTLIDELVAQLGVPASMKISLSSDEPKLFTLRPQLGRVLSNLLSNAVKHHHLGSGNVAVSMQRDNNMWLFKVADDGPGIPLSLQEKALTPFQTLKPRDEVEGSGIGLPLAVRIVERMGGRLWLESDGTHGTSVSFSWPDQIEPEAVS